jgi:hypothetical protein
MKNKAQKKALQVAHVSRGVQGIVDTNIHLFNLFKKI